MVFFIYVEFIQCFFYFLGIRFILFYILYLEYGFKDIQFYIKKDLLDYVRQKIKEIVEFVVELLGCFKEEILFNGLFLLVSFFFVFLVKKVKIWKLYYLNG